MLGRDELQVRTCIDVGEVGELDQEADQLQEMTLLGDQPIVRLDEVTRPRPLRTSGRCGRLCRRTRPAPAPSRGRRRGTVPEVSFLAHAAAFVRSHWSGVWDRSPAPYRARTTVSIRRQVTPFLPRSASGGRGPSGAGTRHPAAIGTTGRSRRSCSGWRLDSERDDDARGDQGSRGVPEVGHPGGRRPVRRAKATRTVKVAVRAYPMVSPTILPSRCAGARSGPRCGARRGRGRRR